MAAKQLIGDLDAHTASRLIESSSDLALFLDGNGTILDVVANDPDISEKVTTHWRGRAWADTVTVESREKVAAMLRDAQGKAAHWRQVNHPTGTGDDLPVMYSAVRVAPSQAGRDGGGRIVAFGRDLRSTMALQRRLIESQQAMERDYWRFREAETRYRSLFQTATEPVLIVDGQSQKIAEANPAAETLLARVRPRVVGAALASLFDDAAAQSLQALLAAARTVGRREPERLQLADGRTEVAVSASVFRQDQTAFLLVRLVPAREAGAAADGVAGALAGSGETFLQSYVSNARDGLVFTDPHGRIVSVNRAFATLAQLSAEEQARGAMLDRWLGRTGVEMGVLISNLRQHGSVGLFSTSLRGELGAVVEVEISASLIASAEGPTLAFAVRDIGRRLQGEEKVPDRISRSVSELAELVGRVPLRQIVLETTDLIERMCIETALQMTNGNRASAAQLLGLSRQSLYVKLRRFGLGGLGGEGDD